MPYKDPQGEKAKARYLQRKLSGRANAASRKYAAAHPEIVRERKRAWNAKRWEPYMEIIKVYKVACELCGYNKHPVALDFDHINPLDKKFGIASLRARPRPIEEVLAEIAKCRVLCANCHRIATYTTTGV